MTSFFADERKKELLIAGVQAYSCLYDPTVESYHNKFTRNNAWLKIVNEIGCPGQGRRILIVDALVIVQCCAGS